MIFIFLTRGKQHIAVKQDFFKNIDTIPLKVILTIPKIYKVI